MDAPGDKDLLCWAIEHAKPTGDQTVPTAIDPEKLAFLKAALEDTDAKRMRDAVGVAFDAEAGLEARLIALDNLELLIENLDNAQDLNRLGLWPKILTGLASSIEEVVLFTLWIVGTAAQNNREVQDVLFGMDIITGVTAVLQNVEDGKLLRKTLYALSSLLGGHSEMIAAFRALNGPQTLRVLVADSEPSVSDRARFVLETVVERNPNDETSSDRDHPQ